MSGPSAQKKCKKNLGFSLDLTYFWLPFGTFWETFLKCFLEHALFAIFLHVVPKVAPRPPKIEAKWSRNGAQEHLVECARTMVFTVREAYREVWGELREPTFYKPRRLTCQEKPRRGF